MSTRTKSVRRFSFWGGTGFEKDMVAPLIGRHEARGGGQNGDLTISENGRDAERRTEFHRSVGPVEPMHRPAGTVVEDHRRNAPFARRPGGRCEAIQINRSPPRVRGHENLAKRRMPKSCAIQMPVDADESVPRFFDRPGRANTYPEFYDEQSFYALITRSLHPIADLRQGASASGPPAAIGRYW